MKATPRASSKDTPRASTAEVADRLGVPVYSLITLQDLLAYLQEQGRREQWHAVERYREQYGAQLS